MPSAVLGLAGAYASSFRVVSGAPSLCALALSVTSQSGVVGVVDLFREQISGVLTVCSVWGFVPL